MDGNPFVRWPVSDRVCIVVRDISSGISAMKISWKEVKAVSKIAATDPLFLVLLGLSILCFILAWLTPS